jgi:type IV pilus biogenesis protein CpaD/CtpE
MRRMPLLALALVLALALAGCGKDESSKKVAPLGDDTETSAPPTPSATASQDAGTTRFDDKGHEALRGDIDATTPQEKAVVDAWIAYWQSRADSYAAADTDDDLGKYATGPAVSDVVRYVAMLKSRKLRTVGDTRYDVSDIAVTGDRATLTSCATSKSIDQFADGTPAEQPVPAFTVKGVLVEQGGAWRVQSAAVRDVPSCS